jgi:hypothetical protein
MPSLYCRRRLAFDAGWSSPVARQAHNLKAAGSNPAPATSVIYEPLAHPAGGFSSFTPVPANSLAGSVSGQLRLPRAIIGLTGIHEIVINKR